MAFDGKTKKKKEKKNCRDKTPISMRIVMNYNFAFERLANAGRWPIAIDFNRILSNVHARAKRRGENETVRVASKTKLFAE